jgi:hypothetical protein
MILNVSTRICSLKSLTEYWWVLRAEKNPSILAGLNLQTCVSREAQYFEITEVDRILNMDFNKHWI